MTFYKNNIPQANDILSESQFDIRQNYKAINEFVSRNHVPLTSFDNQGAHTHVIYKSQGAVPATSADEIALYSEDNGNGRINLRARYQSSGAEINATPFSFGRIKGLAGNNTFFPVTPVNVNQATSTYAIGGSFVVNFTTNAANSNYFVFVSLENLSATSAPLFGTPTVHSKGVGGFTVQVANLEDNTFMNFQVYEQ